MDGAVWNRPSLGEGDAGIRAASKPPAFRGGPASGFYGRRLAPVLQDAIAAAVSAARGASHHARGKGKNGNPREIAEIKHENSAAGLTGHARSLRSLCFRLGKTGALIGRARNNVTGQKRKTEIKKAESRKLK